MIKRTLTAAMFLAAAAGTTTASAQQLALKGSDTLEFVTKDVVMNKCSNAMMSAVLSYAGGGSGGGNDAMKNGTQVIAPMSSALSNDPTEGHCASSPHGIVAANNAQQMVIGLDGIAVVVDSGSSQDCGSSGGTSPTSGHAARTGGDSPTGAPTPSFSRLAYSGTFTYGTSSTYTIGLAPSGSTTATTWKDVLRILYAGYDTTMADSNTGASGGPGNCNSDIRKGLVASYANLWQGGCTTNANCPNGVKHAYRRDDLSGTTDTFLGLVGLPKLTKDSNGIVTNTPFCNGTTIDDNDPIRRACDASEQVCEYDGTLGLVLPITVPTNSEDANELFNGGTPPFGRFLGAQAPVCPNAAQWIIPGVLPAPAAIQNQASSLRCDCRFPTPNDFFTAGVDEQGNPTATPYKNARFNWNTRVGGKCQVPSTTTVTSTARFGLLNGDDGTRDNTPVSWGNRYNNSGFLKCCSVLLNGVSTQVTEDPRAVNFAFRKAAPGLNGDFYTGPTKPDGQTNIGFSLHRLHAVDSGKSNVALATPGNALCQKTDSTESIGCLVEFPAGDKCSVGFAGLDSSDKAFAERVALNNIDSTVTTIQALVAGGTTYPLARKLFINSLVGFGNLAESVGTHTGSSSSFAPGCTGMGVPNASCVAADDNAHLQTNAQYNLAKCFYQDYLDGSPSITAKGFIALPAGVGSRPAGKPFCQNACGDNVCGSDTEHTSVFDGYFSR